MKKRQKERDRRIGYKRVGLSPAVRSKIRVPTRALEKAISQDQFATCDEMEQEIFRVLTSKFHWHPDRVQLAMDVTLAKAIRVDLKQEIQLCRDSNDDMFLECALLANADLIVAGDKDLLILDPFRSIRILTPAQYLT